MLEGVSPPRLLLPVGMAIVALVAVVAVAMGTVPMGSGPPRAASPVATAAQSRPFSEALPASPRLARRSAAMVHASITPYLGSANLSMSFDWGIPVFSARPGDPVRRISLFSWAPAGHRPPISFPIPDAARASGGSDHHLTVLSGGWELDLWSAHRLPNGDWRVGAWVRVRRGSAVAGRVAATASGFALTAGLVRPQEIAAGHIDHALLLTTPYISRRHVPPAVSGDGHQADPNALPMGSHLQLDPAADISHLPRTQRILAQALKTYGAYVGDSGGSLAIRAQASLSPSARAAGAPDPWSAAGVGNPSLRGIPWSRLRVVAP